VVLVSGVRLGARIPSPSGGVVKGVPRGAQLNTWQASKSNFVALPHSKRSCSDHFSLPQPS
jgi:hypothetical protein